MNHRDIKASIESITGINIIKIRIWSDLALSSNGRAGITAACPFRSGIEWLSFEELPDDLSANLQDSIMHYGRIKCEICEAFISKYPEITKPLSKTTGGNCPCHRFKSISVLIESLSEQLLKYESLVNKKVSKHLKYRGEKTK